LTRTRVEMAEGINCGESSPRGSSQPDRRPPTTDAYAAHHNGISTLVLSREHSFGNGKTKAGQYSLINWARAPWFNFFRNILIPYYIW